jgi:hypothetical protein
MTMFKTAVLVLSLWLAPLAAPAAFADSVVADVQIQSLGREQYVVRVRSTAPQAFDVLSGGGTTRLAVRLYRAQLGTIATNETAEFGVVSLAEETAGHVLVRIDLADTRYRIRVTQGSNPNVVEIRISR